MRSGAPNLFYKIIHADPPFLVPRRLADIGKENFGAPGQRPLVLFSDPQEAFEKSLWFYAHNTLPLTGEPNNVPLTCFMARNYGIDALVSELPLAREFLSRFSSEYETDRIASLTLIGRYFSFDDLLPLFREGRVVRALLALPDIGAFAESCGVRLSAGELLFPPDATSAIALEDGMLVARLGVERGSGPAPRFSRRPAIRAAFPGGSATEP